MRPKLVWSLSGVWIGLLFAILCLSANAQTPSSREADQFSNVPSMPSAEEIGALLNKASEYVETYKQTFAYAKPSLDKAPPPGFYDAGMTLSAQASTTIAAITKDGSSAYALVSLVAILDDMSLNAAKASAATTLVAIDGTVPKDRGMNDLLSLATVGTKCYDISELLLHTTLRFIATEEAALRVMLNTQKPDNH